MLTSPTTPTAGGLLAPDAALPTRDQHLDTAWVCRRLAELTPGVAVEPVRLVRSKYRIGESLRVVHRVVRDGVATTVTGRVFPGRAASVARTSPDALHDPDHDTVWWAFPADRTLRGVEDVVHANPYLADELGLPTWASSEVAEYAPERSLTVRADDHTGRAVAYVKLYGGSVDVGRFAARYERAGVTLRGAPLVAVPRVIGRTDTAIAISPMPGVTWTRVGGHAAGVLGRLGAAIAHFHGTPGDGLAAPFGRLQVPRVVHSADLVGTARPELASSLRLVADRLAGGPPPGDEQVLLHGDCHPENSLVDGDRLALIDLDQAGIGSAACDLASLLARLHHGAILGETDCADADRLGAAFLEGYATVRALPRADSLRWHYAAALVAERAIRAVNRVNLRSLARLDQLVALAVDATHPSLTGDVPTVAGRASDTEGLR